MEFYEEAVMRHLTRDQKTFVIPQFSIGTEKGEWSCPDFVAICPPSKCCYVVEVSIAYNLRTLAQKVRDKDYQWLDKLKAQLQETGVTDKTWSYEVLVFVRQDRVKWFDNVVKGMSGVTVYDIERTLTPWNL